MAHKSFSVRQQEAQRGTFPSWLPHQLCQEVICHTLSEPPRLFPLCCIVFPADIRQILSLIPPAKQPQFPQPLLIRLVLQTLHQLCCPSLDTLQPLNVSLGVRGPKLNTAFETKQPQFPQPLLIRLVLQTLHQLRCPSLDTLQHLNVSLVVRGPKLNTVFEIWPHQCRVQGEDHCPTPAGHAIFDTSQDAIGFLGCLGTLPAHIQAAVNQLSSPEPTSDLEAHHWLLLTSRTVTVQKVSQDVFCKLGSINGR
ncbi:hypothetical protein QYF61_006779 [Mycteria americana]|uniref:Uncharacterized protein n=1 Tax=Mycteria americana TaxID=33587 RepID=A0AAN7N138_MYCAM|nr:hypothetical protein QYF61_006779 [Mycteria americana]